MGVSLEGSTIQNAFSSILDAIGLTHSISRCCLASNIFYATLAIGCYRINTQGRTDAV
jgi:hypothetical protein